jgi:hypothetical protein
MGAPAIVSSVVELVNMSIVWKKVNPHNIKLTGTNTIVVPPQRM